MKIALVVLGIAVIVLSWLLKRGAGNTSASTSSWKIYVGGQGTLLFGFLLIGGVLAWFSSFLGPSPGKVVPGGKLVEYHVDPSKQVLFEEQEVQNYRRIMVLTQTAEPKDASATIILYGESFMGDKHELGRIETGAGAWSRWEQPNSIQRLTIAIATGAGAHPATKVDLLLFLSSE